MGAFVAQEREREEEEIRRKEGALTKSMHLLCIIISVPKEFKKKKKTKKKRGMKIEVINVQQKKEYTVRN